MGRLLSAASRTNIVCVALGVSICAISWIGGLRAADARVVTVQPPDAIHQAIVARNLVEGRGFTIGVIALHIGLKPQIEHVPEMHGLLQPLVLAGIYSLAEPVLELQAMLGETYAAVTGMLVFAVAMRRFGAPAGLLATLLYVTSPVVFLWPRLGTDDAGFAMFFMACLLLISEALESRRPSQFVWAGVVAGFAILQKLMGLFLPAIFLAPLLLRIDSVRRLFLRWLIPAAIPLVLCFGLYMVRNYLSFGGFGFRFGALDWLLKSGGYERAYEFMERAPAFSGIVETLGVPGVFALILNQFHHFLWLVLQPVLELLGQERAGLVRVMSPVWGPTLSFVALGLLARSQPALVVVSALAIAGGALFVCIPYHVEGRYFLYLTPLMSVLLAGGLVWLWKFSAEGRSRWVMRTIAMAVGALLFVPSISPLVILAVRPFQSYGRAIANAQKPLGDCVAWMNHNLPPQARVASFSPFHVNWISRLEAVNMPGGGEQLMQRVIEHYAIDYLHLSPDLRAKTLRSARSLVARPPEGWTSKRVYLGKECAIHRYGRAGSRRPREHRGRANVDVDDPQPIPAPPNLDASISQEMAQTWR